MKLSIKVYLNRVQPYQDDFEKVRQYYLKHGVEITWNFSSVDVRGYVSQYTPAVKRYLLTGTPSLVTQDLDITMFVFDEAEWINEGKPLETPAGHCYEVNNKPFIDAPTYPYDHETGIQWVMFAHEIMHALCYMANRKGVITLDLMDSYKENTNPDSLTGNFSQQWTLLQTFLKGSDSYKYFKASEVVGLKPELVSKLDQARGIAGVPFKITSGFRTVAHNASVGGVDGSEHTVGLGCDISAPDSTNRFKIVYGAIQAGFTRIGVYNNHIHLGVGKSPAFPQNVLWNSDKE